MSEAVSSCLEIVTRIVAYLPLSCTHSRDSGYISPMTHGSSMGQTSHSLSDMQPAIVTVAVGADAVAAALFGVNVVMDLGVTVFTDVLMRVLVLNDVTAVLVGAGVGCGLYSFLVRSLSKPCIDVGVGIALNGAAGGVVVSSTVVAVSS